MKAKTLRILVAVAVALSFAAALQVEELWAQTYPTKVIKIIVPFPPGNTMDIMSRLIAPKMQERLGQPVIVENRPGASGMLGLGMVAKAAPDGYTIGAGQGGNLCVIPHTRKNVPYDTLKDFVTVAVSTTNHLVIVTNTSQPFKTLPEMIAYAKAHPGKMTVCSNGEGGYPHLSFEDLRMRAGFTYNYIPYKGSAQMIPDVIGGQVQVQIDGVIAPTPHIQSGRMILLAPTGKTRARLWPGIRTARETVPGYVWEGWFGFIAPAGTPKEIVAKLNSEINRAMKSPEVESKMVAGGMAVVAESPEYWADFIKQEYDKYGKVARDINFQKQ